MEIQKASFRYFVTAYIQSKKRNQQRRFPCNVLRDLKQNFIREKSQKTKIRTSYEIGNLPIRHTYTCVDCVSHISVSSVSLAVEILRKNDKASQVKCRQRPPSRLPLRRHFHRERRLGTRQVKDHSDRSRYFWMWWGKIRPWKTFLGARSVRL